MLKAKNIGDKWDVLHRNSRIIPYCSDDDTIYQSNRILQPLVDMNLNYNDEKKLIQCRTEESDEYR